MNSPPLSILTITLNSERTLRATMESVLSQSFKDFEYLIMDGGSRDSTLEIARSFNDPRLRIYSEKDSGISDAMNRGIKKCQGKIIGIIHSDDTYEPNTFEVAISAFEKPEVCWLYGKVAMQNEQQEVVFVAGQPFNLKKLKRFMIIPHPSVFCRRGVYEECGLFRLRYRLAMDYELCLRFALRYSPLYIDRVLARMTLGGASTRSLKNELKAGFEAMEAKHALLGIGHGQHLAYFFWMSLKCAIRRILLQSNLGIFLVSKLRRFVNPYMSAPSSAHREKKSIEFR